MQQCRVLCVSVVATALLLGQSAPDECDRSYDIAGGGAWVSETCRRYSHWPSSFPERLSFEAGQDRDGQDGRRMNDVAKTTFGFSTTGRCTTRHDLHS